VAGLADDNVHYQNMALLIKRLYENNVKFDQLTFPDKNHGISGGNTRFYLYSRMVEWLKGNL
jgi:dipeptidyl-peptidase-4